MLTKPGSFVVFNIILVIDALKYSVRRLQTKKSKNQEWDITKYNILPNDKY